jgi:probable HAF family extracellular repeat protein
VVVGYSYLGEDGDAFGYGGRAFRWTDGVMHNLGTLGGDYSDASAVSADGAVVVGQSRTEDSVDYWGDRAFRWTSADGMQDLGTLGGTQSWVAWRNGLSADGSAVVGTSTLADNAGYRAFRWTTASGMQDLGSLSGGDTSANAISADGRVVVGEDFGVRESEPDSMLMRGYGGDRQAFRWSEDAGMQSIGDWTGVGDIGLTGTTATGVNADGSVVVGQGYDEELDRYIAWLARKGGIMNPDQWLQSLQASQQVFQSGEYLTRLALNGARHRPLASYANAEGSNSCVWANGDLGTYGYGRDADVGLGEVGVCGSRDGWTAGIAVGHAWQRQDFSDDGKLDVDGQYFSAEVNWLLPNAPLLLSTVAMAGSYDAEMRRGYANGAGQSSSSGDTDVRTLSLRLRADWLDAARIGEVALTPWTAVTATKTEVDSYTETGGAFPARFDSQDDTAEDVRLGLTASYQLTSTATLRGTVETVHSLDDNAPSLTGEALGLFSFDQEGQEIENNWQRVGVEVDQLVGKSGLVSVSLFGANEGQDPNGSVAVKYLHRF